MNALDRAVSDGTIAAPMLRLVRPVGVTGETGSPVQNGGETNERRREGPVGTGARMVVLRSAGHLERLQTSRRRRKNSRWRLEKLGFGEKVKKIKSRVCIDLIDWISSIGRDPLYL